MRASLTSLAAATARRLPLRARLWLYRLGPVTRWLRGTLNRAVPAGVQPVQIAAGGIAGSWLLLDLRVDKDLWLGNYEPDVAAAIQHLVLPGKIAYDLGANVGYTSLLLARAVGPEGHVFAFEPLPDNLERLRRAVALNGLESRIAVVPAALGARSGTADFRVHASGGMGRLEKGVGREGGFVGATSVEVMTLDAFVFDDGHPVPDVVKMDVEGGEVAAIEGMRRLLRERPPLLLVELHGAQAAAAVSSDLRACGYQLHRMEPGYPEIASNPPEPFPKHIVAQVEEGRS